MRSGEPVVVLDVANVMGSRPDGWWRDRAGAAERVLADAARVLRAGGAVAVLAVLEGRARTATLPSAPGLEVVLAPGEGDDTIVDVAVRAFDALAGVGAGDVVVVTADRGLRERLPGAALAVGPRWWFDLVDAARADDGRPDEHEEVLTGGNMTAVVRRGDAVHRTAGPWTPTVHRLLEHLRERGITWLPQPLGTDERGREVLTHLPGTVPAYPMPAFVWTQEVLVTSARWLALAHEASAGFDAAGALWQLPAHEPVEVVCLNDVAPYNMVFDAGGCLTGWIDVDVASPGPRAWDLAHLAYRLVPLTAGDDTGAGPADLGSARERLALLCAAYAGAGDRVGPGPAEVLDVVVARLHDLAAFTAARAAAGADHVADHVALYRSDAAWVESHAAVLGAGGGL